LLKEELQWEQAKCLEVAKKT